ncbi:hypothetical protein CVS40_7792 [Lucilia cuprina]|nr:hypothetical protein CVS40_7792 [Lucilia cuprina]
MCEYFSKDIKPFIPSSSGLLFAIRLRQQLSVNDVVFRKNWSISHPFVGNIVGLQQWSEMPILFHLSLKSLFD